MSNRYVDELLSADEVLTTTPTCNLSLPAALKPWIDQVVRAGRTFEVSNGGFKGLASAWRAIVIVASGGDYRLSSPGGAHNFLEPYLRATLAFIGITTVELVDSHRLNAGATKTKESVAAAEHRMDGLADRTTA